MAEPADDKDRESSSVWRYARASRAHVVIDAEAYFELIRDAMLGARQRIFLIGWDFDTRIKLSGGRRWWNLPRLDRYPARLGAFVVWVTKRVPGLQVNLLKWNFGALRFLFRGSMIVDLVRWFVNRSISFKFDAAHPVGCSQHEKIAVIDDSLAVCGGIDLTSDRWDTRAHLPEDPRRRRASGKLYPPWHDVTMMMEGEVAGALAELGRQRWGGQAENRSKLAWRGKQAPGPSGSSRNFATSKSVLRGPGRDTMAARAPSRSRRCSSSRSNALAGLFMPKASISPRGGSQRRSRAGCPSPIRLNSS